MRSRLRKAVGAQLVNQLEAEGEGDGEDEEGKDESYNNILEELKAKIDKDEDEEDDENDDQKEQRKREYDEEEKEDEDVDYNEVVKKDPLLKYGVGVKNYFLLQTHLIKVFSVLSLLAIIQMSIFGSYDGLDYLGDKIRFYAKYSFGNFGFSGSMCSRSVINWDDPLSSKLILQC